MARWPARTVEERFWEKVNEDGPIPEQNPGLRPCWVWTAGVDRRGYGRFGFRPPGMKLAHRVAYFFATGTWPDELDHLCRRPGCVRPSHLEPVAHLENVRRGNAGQVNATRLRSKTHCKRNHEFTPENTRLDGRGHRSCRVCSRELHRSYYHADLNKSRQHGREKQRARTARKRGEL